MANYRTRVNFVWEALEGSEIALKRLYRLYKDLGEDTGKVNGELNQKFKNYLADDLDTPRALSLLWDVFKDEFMSNADKRATVLEFDKVLGLGFDKIKEEVIPDEITELVKEREEARTNKDFKKSDELRDKIKSLGYEIKDSSGGNKIEKIQ